MGKTGGTSRDSIPPRNLNPDGLLETRAQIGSGQEFYDYLTSIAVDESKINPVAVELLPVWTDHFPDELLAFSQQLAGGGSRPEESVDRISTWYGTKLIRLLLDRAELSDLDLTSLDWKPVNDFAEQIYELQAEVALIDPNGKSFQTMRPIDQAINSAHLAHPAEAPVINLTWISDMLITLEKSNPRDLVTDVEPLLIELIADLSRG
jgi:hypothetical protein